MGITKTSYFSLEQNEFAVKLKAMAHPARIAILEFLLKSNDCICGDIVNELPLSQASISQHLRELKDAGLIKGTIEGKSICYCIDQTAFTALTKKITAIEQKLLKKNKKCC